MNPSHASSEFDREFETERARWLRRRFLWFCGLMVLVDTLFGLGTLATVVGGGPNAPIEAIGLVLTAPLVVLYLVAAVFAWRRAPSQPVLVRLAVWLTSIDGITWLIYLYLDRVINVRAGQSSAVADWGGMVVAAIVFIHLVPCLFLPWTLGECLRPAAVLLGANLLTVVVDVGMGRYRPWVGLVVLLLSAVAVVPGALICWIRYSRFREIFQLRFESGRYRKLQSELLSARRVHESCLPPPRDDGPVRLNYVYEPMRQIGGDLLFVHPPLDAMRDGSEAFSAVILDVTGHGIAAALTVNRLVGELERLFSENPGVSPGDVLRGLNRYVTITLSRYELYATALCLRVDTVRDVLEWASGGHPPALVRRADGRVEPLDSTAPMLGVLEPDEYDPEPARTPFGPGDVFVGYTDGASEAADGRGEQLGTGGVQRLLSVASSDGAAPADWPAVMLEGLSAHRGGAPEDDTLIVALCRPASTSSKSPT